MECDERVLLVKNAFTYSDCAAADLRVGGRGSLHAADSGDVADLR
jgi:hypothetical protein